VPEVFVYPAKAPIEICPKDVLDFPAFLPIDTTLSPGALSPAPLPIITLSDAPAELF